MGKGKEDTKEKTEQAEGTAATTHIGTNNILRNLGLKQQWEYARCGWETEQRPGMKCGFQFLGGSTFSRQWWSVHKNFGTGFCGPRHPFIIASIPSTVSYDSRTSSRVGDDRRIRGVVRFLFFNDFFGYFLSFSRIAGLKMLLSMS